MKTTGTLQSGNGLWQHPNSEASNGSGFAGLPSGGRMLSGNFNGIGSICYFYSSSEYNSFIGWALQIDHYLGIVRVDTDGGKRSGYPVRCLKD